MVDLIELDLTMAIGAEEAQDRIEIAGPVPLTAIIPGATPGDSATVAALINGAKIISGVGPGLKTVLDIPPATCRRLSGVARRVPTSDSTRV